MRRGAGGGGGAFIGGCCCSSAWVAAPAGTQRLQDVDDEVAAVLVEVEQAGVRVPVPPLSASSARQTRRGLVHALHGRRTRCHQQGSGVSKAPPAMPTRMAWMQCRRAFLRGLGAFWVCELCRRRDGGAQNAELQTEHFGSASASPHLDAPIGSQLDGT